MDRMEEVVGVMDQYRYEGWQQELFLKLKDAVEDVDVDACAEIMRNWLSAGYGSD